MIINIASFGGRSHLLDTARELEKFGHKVRFYSYVPTQRAMKFGLKKECSYTLYYYALPFLTVFKIFGFTVKTKMAYFRFFDYFTAFYMRKCDIFIGQSPMHVFSMKYAKKKYNAITIMECGTSHVLEQIKALNSNPILKGKPALPKSVINRALEGYRNSDFLSVGSQHVKESFIKNGALPDNIFVNNYGFDSSAFKPTKLSNDPYDIIFVGQWSHRKGADLLIQLCEQNQYRLLHVGSILDIPFPKEKNYFTHIPPVNETELINYYENAKIFVLPSREEGLALVQSQALACGLPIVCSKKTGGIDLRKYVVSNEWIIELDQLDLKSLKIGVEQALRISNTQTGIRSYSNIDPTQSSWTGYGQRYSAFIKSIKY